MYIQRNTSKSKTGKEYTSILLCSKYRQEGKIKTRVEANLSQLPAHIILGIENMLKSEKETTVCLKDISVSRCIDYGYIYVLLHVLRQLRIDEVLAKTLPPSDAALVKAMIIGKIVTGGSKLCICNWLLRESTIRSFLGVDASSCTTGQMYESLKRLYGCQPQIEKKWFRYHRGAERRIFLYDITSSYFEGTKNELAAYGYNRDRKSGKKQPCIGLLTDAAGFPLRIQAFAGNTADCTTVVDQLLSLKKEFGVEQIVFVGDRGMQIMYNLENDPQLREEHIEFITGLTRTEINELIRQEVIELNLFTTDLAEVRLDDRRYVLSVNPELEAKELYFLSNRRKQADALVEQVRSSWNKRCIRNRENPIRQQENAKKHKNLKTELNVKDIDRYKLRVARGLKECGMNRYYQVVAIDSESFEVEFNREEFERSRSLCGKYAVCSNVPVEEMTAGQVRGEYKKLQHVEHAFRDLKSENIHIRPVYHYKEPTTRGHVLLCMFAYAIIKELEDKLYPFLKEYNKNSDTQLSFNDMTAELNNIKMCEMRIGKSVNAIHIPALNRLQTEIMNVLNIDPKKMMEQCRIKTE